MTIPTRILKLLFEKYFRYWTRTPFTPNDIIDAMLGASAEFNTKLRFEFDPPLMEMSLFRLGFKVAGHIVKFKRIISRGHHYYRLWQLENVSEGSFGSLIIAGDNSILLVQTAEARRWGLPKGHLEANETKLECAIREVYEETGLDIQTVIQPNNFEFFNYRNSLGGKKWVGYFVTLLPDKPQFKNWSDEISNIDWFSIEEVAKLISPSTFIILERLLKHCGNRTLERFNFKKLRPDIKYLY